MKGTTTLPAMMQPSKRNPSSMNEIFRPDPDDVPQQDPLVQIAVNIRRSTRQALKVYAAEQDRTQKQIIDQAINEYLERNT
jgi:hypothetical protein